MKPQPAVPPVTRRASALSAHQAKCGTRRLVLSAARAGVTATLATAAVWITRPAAASKDLLPRRGPGRGTRLANCVEHRTPASSSLCRRTISRARNRPCRPITVRREVFHTLRRHRDGRAGELMRQAVRRVPAPSHGIFCNAGANWPRIWGVFRVLDTRGWHRRFSLQFAEHGLA